MSFSCMFHDFPPGNVHRMIKKHQEDRSDIWRCPKHPFFFGMFHEINHPAMDKGVTTEHPNAAFLRPRSGRSGHATGETRGYECFTTPL